MLVVIAQNNFAAQLSSPVQSIVVISDMADYDEHDRISICLLLYILIGWVVKWLITVSALLVNVEKETCCCIWSQLKCGQIVVIFFLAS